MQAAFNTHPSHLSLCLQDAVLAVSWLCHSAPQDCVCQPHIPSAVV